MRSKSIIAIKDAFDEADITELEAFRHSLKAEAEKKDSRLTLLPFLLKACGHALAVNLASSGMSPTARLSHQFSGLQGIKTLKTMTRQLQEPEFLASLLDKMSRIHDQIMVAPRRFLLVGEEQHRNTLLSTLEASWSKAPAVSDAVEPLQLTPIRETVKELWTTNTQVHFCAKAYPTVPSGHADHPALSVLGGVMRNAFLHRTIREQGGAYGAGADQDGNAAAFRFFSYRDPRLQETLDDFDRAVDWVLNEPHEWQQIEEAILGVISSMDRSTSPAGAARQAFFNELFGRDRAHRMAFRERVLNVNLEQLQEVATRYLKPELASVGVVSHREANVPEGLKVENL
jgi:Zn-dependent M16 (insulinase) family peptidase